MRRYDLLKMARGEEIVKCACGLPMRQKDWMDHWRTCYVGSPMDVTEEDRQMVLAAEGRLFIEAQEHREWLRKRDEQYRDGKIDAFGRVLA